MTIVVDYCKNQIVNPVTSLKLKALLHTINSACYFDTMWSLLPFKCTMFVKRWKFPF